MLVRAAFALVFASVAAAGCGDYGEGRSTGQSPARDGAAPAAAQETLPPTPDRVLSRCRSLQQSREVRVRCPDRLPAGRWVVTHATLRSGRCAYLFDANARPFGSGEAFHLLAGGRCVPLSLRAERGRWPTQRALGGAGRGDDLLGLVGSKPLTPGQPATARPQRVRLLVRRTARIKGNRALVLGVIANDQGGGLHGGHVAVIWNQGGDGYAISLHFPQETTLDDRRLEDVVLAAAGAMSRAR